MTLLGRFTRSFLLPQLLVLGITLLALFTLFWAMVPQQNQLARDREVAQVETGLAGRVDFVARNLRDYSIWNDAVEHLAVRLDRDWANANIGPYLFDVQGYANTFVLTPEGKTEYASEGAHESTASARDVLGGEVDLLLARLNRAPAGKEERFARLASLDGRPAIVAASVILPSIGTRFAQPFQRRYLVFVQPVDAAMLARLAADYKISGLRFEPGGAIDRDLATIQLKDALGRPIGRLAWTPSRPGDRTRDTYLPFVVLIAAIAIAAGIFVLRLAQRATSDLAASEASARHLANHDMLTGLPNRRALWSRGLKAGGSDKAVVYLDLDGFKEVNDLFGHQAGDALLKEAVLRLRQAIGERGFLARVGGDEFAVLVVGPHSHRIAAELAAQIVVDMAEPFLANHIKMLVSASVGVALGDGDAVVDDLARFADVAMYSAKDSGKNCWRLYDPEMDEGRANRKLLESELREAVRNKDIGVVFQPIVDARRGTISCVEALARWESPTQGSVGPAIFVPIAEASGLIVELGELVLRKACQAARDWPVNIAVNLSPAQFWHQGLAQEILAILTEYDFPPHRLELEITEGYLLSRPETAIAVIAELRALGIRVALDDFGTGFASIGYIKRFDLDRIKLDRSFVDSVDEDEDAMMVAQAVIALGQAMKLPITAEGVENMTQSNLLRIAGCERLQGWYFGRPGPAAEMDRMFGTAPEAAPPPEATPEPAAPEPQRRRA